MVEMIIAFETEEQYSRAVAGIASFYNYDQYVSEASANEETPMTEEEYARKQVIDFIGRTVKDYESAKAAELAKQAVEKDVNDGLGIS